MYEIALKSPDISMAPTHTMTLDQAEGEKEGEEERGEGGKKKKRGGLLCLYLLRALEPSHK